MQLSLQAFRKVTRRRMTVMIQQHLGGGLFGVMTKMDREWSILESGNVLAIELVADHQA